MTPSIVMDGNEASTPMVSVIVPIYNVEDYVGQTIESLLAQTFTDFEVICVNDGSTDASEYVAYEAAEGDWRFRFVKRHNGGLSAARNTGVVHARGEYVTFLDSDDYYAPDALERLCAAASADDLDLVDFSAFTFYEDEGLRNVHEEDFYEKRKPIEGVVSGAELFMRHMEQGSYVPSACMHMARRSIVSNPDLQFLEGCIHEDELFSPILYGLSGKAAFLSEPLYARRMREGSIMTVKRGIVNIDAEFRIAQQLHAWIVAHAGECTSDFIDAYTQNMANLCFWAYLDVLSVGEEAIASYVGTLDAQDRVAFNQMIRQPSIPSDRRYQEIIGSRAYRLGEAIARIPRAIMAKIGQAG